MDPKISKKTQDSLGKFIKKPPLTEKLLSKPPFRFLHDVMTSVIKSTGVMKGLYTESELNSENVKDRDSKIAFLQKALDYVSAATGKQMSAKPAKVVAGHEPEKTNEFLQGLAQAIASKVDNDEIISKINNKGEKSSSKKEEKEEKPNEREKSNDRRKRDEEKSREPVEEKERSKDREDRNKDREDRHRDRDKDDKNKRREEKSKDRENKDRDRDRERERESRHKSGRSRLSKTKNRNNLNENQENAIDQSAKLTPDEIDSDVLLSGDEMDDGTIPGNATFAVLRPSQIVQNENFPPHPDTPQVFKHIPRQLSTIQENLNVVKPEETLKIRKTIGDGKEDGTLEESGLDEEMDHEMKMFHRQADNGHKTNRPKAARPRRISKTLAYDVEDNFNTSSKDFHTLSKPPGTPNVSEKDYTDAVEVSADINDVIINSDDAHFQGFKKKKIRSKGKRVLIHSGQDKNVKKFPRTSTPNESPQSPKKISKHHNKSSLKTAKYSSPVKQTSDMHFVSGSRRKSLTEQNTKQMRHLKKEGSKTKQTGHKSSDKVDIRDTQSDDFDNKRHRERIEDERFKEDFREVNTYEDMQVGNRKKRDKQKYRNDDYAHEKIKAAKRREEIDRRKGNHDESRAENYVDKQTEIGDRKKAFQEQYGIESYKDEYYKKKKPRGVGDQRRRSNFSSILDSPKQKREEEGKENDAPKENLVNGEHKTNDAPAKMQRPTSAKGSRRRMEDVPAQKQEPTLGDDDLPPQIQGRLARPSSARPAPPKRKEDIVSSEPAMRLGSGKPQNLILDDGKDSDEDETFVVEESAPHHEEPQQPPAPLVDDDDEDHGGLVKKIMESKKEYEQPRETKIERPTISDAQRRKQREAVQREIDKLRGSIQTLTRSANPLGKIMDYVQEDLDSMQKELEKWKEENKEHALALKREKAITERAVEPLRAQLTEVDQAIKDQLDLIGAVKSNIIRNDQKMEKMLRTIAKS